MRRSRSGGQIAAVDPLFPVGDVESLDARLAKTLAYPRFRAVVLAFFAFGALILSAVQLHGVLSQLVAQRIPELGIRRALGGETRDLLWLRSRWGAPRSSVGLGAGVCLTLGFGRPAARACSTEQTRPALGPSRLCRWHC